ncbi:MAG TPA: carboxypeptidase regulatory-like domain-containing protein [Candidatus Angelobacter sp.]
MIQKITHVRRRRELLPLRIVKYCFVLLLVLPLLPGYALAQAPSITLHGVVADPSGAVVPAATITIKKAGMQPITTKTDGAGGYELKGLQPGTYTVSVAAKGFSVVSREIEVTAQQEQKLDFALEISAQQAEIVVEGEGARVSTNPENNGASLVLSGKDLDALSDDPDELQSELQALAGPSAGPNGGQIYIDGFTGGQLPPKSSIREIRINQNPFSAEYDKLGFGRIEILTKPGTDKFHGQFFFNDNNAIFNTRNPFVPNQPGYQSEMINGNIGGPINKHASFFFNVERRNINDTNSVVATTLDSNLLPLSLAQAVPNPRTRTSINNRIDYQISTNNTLTARYQFTDINESNDGVGLFSLASLGYNRNSTEHTFQLTDTQVLSPRAVNETRFEYERGNNNLTSQSGLPEILVQGAFTSGGNPIGNEETVSDHYELQNYTSLAIGKHLVKFGGRLRVTSESLRSTQNFNGTFTFASLAAYQAALQNPANQPDQFSIATGQPLVSDTLFDVGIYGQDDWKIRPNLTLSYGLRFESQNDIHDHADIAPRLGIAWGIGGKGNKPPKTILRAGYGIFYDRFPQNLIIQAEQLNGINETQFQFSKAQLQVLGLQVFNPANPGSVPPLSALGNPKNSNVYQIASNLRAPYVMQAAVGLERQLTKNMTVTVNYLNSRGLHQFITDNINAPQPNGTVAFPGQGPIYQFESAGIFKQEQLMTNVNVRAGAKLSLFGFFVINNAHSNTAGPTSFPTNQFNLSQDYGRTPFDVRYRAFFGGSIALPRGFRASPFMIFNSGQPFNIILGQDRNGDTIFNDRPFFANSATQPGAVATPFGVFDPSLTPQPGEQIIPPYLGTGPNQFTFNLRLSKTFGFGQPREVAGKNPQNRGGGDHGGDRGRGGPGGGRGGPVFGGQGGGMGGIFGASPNNRPYNLTFSVSARNLFNTVNLATPIGIITSPRFDQSIALAGGPFSTSDANRRVDLQVMFSF